MVKKTSSFFGHFHFTLPLFNSQSLYLACLQPRPLPDPFSESFTPSCCSDTFLSLPLHFHFFCQLALSLSIDLHISLNLCLLTPIRLH